MSSTKPTDANVDPYGSMGFLQNSNGTVARNPNFILSAIEANLDPSSPVPVLTKDILINQEKNTFTRVYLPKPVFKEPAAAKLPLIFYFYGGGFVMAYTPASNPYHNFCYALVHHIPSVLVSVGYRPAPEHRLPAAYDDCMEALLWARTTDDEWLTNYADFSKCFLAGTSAGGNIAYHLGLRAAACVDRLLPVNIRGLILHHPFFGGVERTPSEIRLMHDKVFPLIGNDACWDLALPIGADRDHEYSNPMKHVREEAVEKMKEQGWRLLVTGYDGDPLVDRQVELAKVMRERGVAVVEMFSNGGCHGIETAEEDKANLLFGVIKSFILQF